MLRAVENMGIEIAFGIIFIGNGELSKENYVKYIERHRITREYMFQSGAFLSKMREKIRMIKNTEAFLQYDRRYQNLLKEKLIAEANRTKQINFYFLNTYEIVTMLREEEFVTISILFFHFIHKLDLVGLMAIKILVVTPSHI